jgi:hypothetical protein
MKFQNVTFEYYMHNQKLMYFSVVVYNREGVYVDEFDNYDLKNYKIDMTRKYADYLVTQEQTMFRKSKGYTISTTIIHIQEN